MKAFQVLTDEQLVAVARVAQLDKEPLLKKVFESEPKTLTETYRRAITTVLEIEYCGVEIDEAGWYQLVKNEDWKLENMEPF